LAAGQVDLADDPAAQQVCVIRFDNFSDKFVSGNTRKTIISALELEIGVTYTCNQQPNKSESIGSLGPPDLTDMDTPLLQPNGKHDAF